MIIVNGWKPLTIITKRSILDVAAVLDPPLVFTYYEDAGGELYMENYLKTKKLFHFSDAHHSMKITTLFINVKFTFCRCCFWFTVILGVGNATVQKNR